MGKAFQCTVVVITKTRRLEHNVAGRQLIATLKASEGNLLTLTCKLLQNAFLMRKQHGALSVS